MTSHVFGNNENGESTVQRGRLGCEQETRKTNNAQAGDVT